MTSISFPIALAEITDDGLRRIEHACRSERVRRAIAAANAEIAARITRTIHGDPEDEDLAALSASELTDLAERLDAEVSANAMTAGHANAQAGGLADAAPPQSPPPQTPNAGAELVPPPSNGHAVN